MGYGAGEFGCNAWFWLFDRHDVLAAYLQSFADQMPLLVAPGFQPSVLARHWSSPWT